VIFKNGEWAWELIIYLLDVYKCDFGDVDEAMFHEVENAFERIFDFLGNQKPDFGEVVELMI
jgi:hypothetical protein